MENNDEEFEYLMPKKSTIVDFSNTLTKEARSRFIQEILMTPEELSEAHRRRNKLDNKNFASNRLDGEYLEECEKFFENLFNERLRENDNHI
jgi:hypothetical protein